MHARTSCLRPPRYSTCVVVTPPNNTATSPDNRAILPIWVADEPKRHKQTQIVFVYDRGFPDETEHYEHLLQIINVGTILHKLKHPPPSLDEVCPQFFCTFNEAKHGEQMRQDLNLSHLEPEV
jgi:hypothetical protein